VVIVNLLGYDWSLFFNLRVFLVFFELNLLFFKLLDLGLLLGGFLVVLDNLDVRLIICKEVIFLLQVIVVELGELVEDHGALDSHTLSI
jgi:hypothetical protein